jgi:hypothetical protein
LTIDVPGPSYSQKDGIKAKLLFHNSSRGVVAIAKPLMPTGWSVKFQAPGEKKTEWEGGVVRGTSHGGGAPRYEPMDYALIDPGGTYEENISVAWYLRNQRDRPPVGEYELTLWYEAPPNESERDLPLIDYRVTSNTVNVSVTSD